MSRGKSTGPQLTFPHVVWIKARPRTAEQITTQPGPRPVWVVQCIARLGDRGTWTQERHTAVPIDQWLNVLVFPAEMTTDVRVVYYRGKVIQHTGVVWRPVVLVGPEGHEPEKAHINPAEWPCIRFQEEPRATE